MSTNAYPEHTKLAKVAADSQVCGEFLEWLQARYTLAQYHTHTDECSAEPGGQVTCGHTDKMPYPTHVDATKLLAEFFEIDSAKLEAEKQAIYEKLQDAARVRRR